MRKKNISLIRPKPQYEKINTIRTFIPALNKCKNTCKRVSDHNRYENMDKQGNKDRIIKIPMNNIGDESPIYIP